MIYIVGLSIHKPSVVPKLDDVLLEDTNLIDVLLKLIPAVYGIARHAKGSNPSLFGPAFRCKFKGVMKMTVCNTALTNSMFFAIIIGATAFSYMFRNLGGDDVIQNGMNSLVLSVRSILDTSIF